jgi:phage shock protein A
LEIHDAKDVLIQYLTSLKLTEKQYAELGELLVKWTARIDLARSKGAAALAAEAEQEAERIRRKYQALEAEIADLKAHIARLRAELPGLAARERTVDPDLLEQELLIAAGRMPGEDPQADRALKTMEQDTTAEAALKALKAKMNQP